MPRKSPWPPKVYPRDGSDYVRFVLGKGRRREVCLGPSGSAEARAEYARLVAEAEAAGRPPGEAGELTVAEALLAYTGHAAGYYERRQQHRVKVALKPVGRLYGHAPAREFGPKALKTVLREYVAAGYCRSYANTLKNVVIACFRWCATEELLPKALADALADVPPLRKGHTPAPEREEVPPADPDAVERTLPELTPVVADLVRFQQLTACRPGEACAVRPADVERQWKQINGSWWGLYKLDKHKTGWRGKFRWVPLSPRALEVLAPYLERPAESHCFSPKESLAQFRARQRAARRTKVQPSQADRSKARPRKGPGDRYGVRAYAQAVERACRRAGVAAWSPNQLRHLVATRVQEELSQEDARCVLGHTHPSATARYARQVERAARALSRLAG